jgi:hypothetical protein
MPRRFKSSRIARHSNIPLLGRTRFMAHLQGALSASGKSGGGRFPLLSVFMQSPFPWLAKYLKGIFKRRYKPYPSYQLDGQDGIYPIRAAAHEQTRISIAGDWGTGTEEAFRVAEHISAFRPDYTIHLGDVYYVGDEQEVNENFLGIASSDNTPVQFPRGSIGTLTLPGNHEMYGGGAPYFQKVIPWGSPQPGEPQRASFFCLESDHWRILGLDTGYNSAGLPILGSLPGLSSIPWIGGDGRIEPAVLDWLRTNVRPHERPKTRCCSAITSTSAASPTRSSPSQPRSSASSFAARTCSGSGATNTASPSTTSIPPTATCAATVAASATVACPWRSPHPNPARLL